MQLSLRLGSHTAALAPAREQLECTAVRHCSEPVYIFMVQSVSCKVHIHSGGWGSRNSLLLLNLEVHWRPGPIIVPYTLHPLPPYCPDISFNDLSVLFIRGKGPCSLSQNSKVIGIRNTGRRTDHLDNLHGLSYSLR
jgi:hypothetical protein